MPFTHRLTSRAALSTSTPDMKLIYRAPIEKAGLLELDRFEKNRGRKYPSALKPWRDNMCDTPAIRKMIYASRFT